jgi:putative peptide zinc metalloprotease protein
VEHGGSDYAVRDHLSAVVRLRADLVISPQPGGLEPGYLIEDPLRGRFFHVGLSEFTVLSLLDGRQTIAEALALAARSLGNQALGEREVLGICQWLMENGLAHTDVSAQSGRVSQALERVARQRRLARLNPLAIRLPLANPDRMLTAAMPWLGWLASPACFVAWCLVMSWAGWIVVRDWRQLTDAPLVLLDPVGGLRLLAAWVGLKLWHETLHAVFCKKYGGRVSNAGIMLLFFTPVAYVDVTSSWRFRSRWQRIATAAAGMYGECLAGGLALVAWSRLPPGGPRHLAYCVSLMALAHTLLFNANPLMRFDGYYILSDLCGVPNLAQRGSQYLAALFSQVVLGIRVPLPAWPARIGRMIRLYALAALAWRVMVYASLALFLVGWLSYLGGLLAAAMFVAAAARPLRRAWQYVRQPGRAAALDWRRIAISGTCSVAMFGGLLAAMCLPGLVRVPGVVEYAPLSIVRAASRGFVRELRVADGSLVTAGQVLLVLENEDLERKARDMALELEQATIQSRLHHQNHELAKYQAEVAQCQALKKKLAEAQAEAGQLVIRAAGDGRLIARGFDQLAGRYLEAGQEIGVIGDPQSKEVRLAIDHEDVDLVAELLGQEISVRVGGAAPRHLMAKLVRVEPQGATDLPHPALSAQVGGPLPVKLKEPADGKPAETYELLSPAFAGVAALPAGAAAELRAGQRVNLTFRSPGETVAGRLRRVLLRWIDAQIEKGRAADL